MNYWIHTKQGLDLATLHRERCLEIPSTSLRGDFWEGGWTEFSDRDTALDALEETGLNRIEHCPLCKP